MSHTSWLSPLTLRLLHASVLYLFLIAAAAVLIMPLLWLISTSLKEAGKELTLPPQLIPQPPMWEKYLVLFQQASFGIFLRNSFLISILAPVGSMLS